MLDRAVLASVRVPLAWGAARLAALGVGADAVSVAGLALGLAGAAAIACGQPLVGLALILCSRVADGLDGTLARMTQPTDRGAFIDCAFDFLFYASVPLAFAMADPAANALPAAVLLAAFIGTGSTFLAFAVLAERRGLKSTAHSVKGFFYLGGLTEGSETIACFALMCLFPQHFPWWAYGFAALCALTIVTRLAVGWVTFGSR
ncbi:MAG: CDP-alcohol phosphatidyltransferase family protein [Rubrivivax sp.]|nr:CDP-alcohol phosphatidyltransferase family protein [Rubrivivax sp.]